MHRVVPGILMIGAWCFLLFWGTAQVFGLLMIVVAARGLYEYFRMVYPQRSPGALAVLLLPCLFPVAAACYGRADLVLGGVFAGLLSLVAVTLSQYARFDDPGLYLRTGGFATIYISLCIAHWVLIFALPQGAFWLLILTAIVAGSDTGAYYAGRALGKRKLCPQISPKKTVAGLVGGLVAGVLAAQLVNLFFMAKASPLLLLAGAILLVLVGIAGDLTESILKRGAGVKDSGALLLGHGGLLDRIDSLLLAGPVLFYLLLFGLLK